MRKTLEVLNELEREGIVTRYAIGGAVAALFYLDPFVTEDLDIFVLIPDETPKLSPLARIYGNLKNHGYYEDGPHVQIEGVFVQFLVAWNPLIIEAVAESQEIEYQDVPSRVLTPEYLAAIMLQTGRDKDKVRFQRMLEITGFDEAKLTTVLKTHGLWDKFSKWTS